MHDGSLSLLKSPYLSWLIFLTSVEHFIAMLGIESALKNFGRKVHDWLKKGPFYMWICFYISTRWICRIYQHSDTFYSFCYKLSSRQHLVNVPFFQLKRTLCGVFICLFIYSFCWWVSLKYISKSEEISVYNKYLQKPAKRFQFKESIFVYFHILTCVC